MKDFFHVVVSAAEVLMVFIHPCWSPGATATANHLKPVGVRWCLRVDLLLQTIKWCNKPLKLGEKMVRKPRIAPRAAQPHLCCTQNPPHVAPLPPSPLCPPQRQPPWPPRSHQPSNHFYPGQPLSEGWVINVPSDTPSCRRGSLGGRGGGAHTSSLSLSHTRVHVHAPNLLHAQAIHQTALTGRALLSAASRRTAVTPRLPQRDHHAP